MHVYLNGVAEKMANDKSFDKDNAENRFRKTFDLIHEAMGETAFRRWDGDKFGGKFLLSMFEVIATGVAGNIESISALSPTDAAEFIKEKSKRLWELPEFTDFSGAGVSGKTRLTKLLPLAKEYMKPP